DRVPNNVTGDSAALAEDFRYGGSPGITLDNLKPNTEYVFNLYGIGFDDPTDEVDNDIRAAAFSSSLSSEPYTMNLNHYGQGNGLIISYSYTTDAEGSP